MKCPLWRLSGGKHYNTSVHEPLQVQSWLNKVRANGLVLSAVVTALHNGYLNDRPMHYCAVNEIFTTRTHVAQLTDEAALHGGRALAGQSVVERPCA